MKKHQNRQKGRDNKLSDKVKDDSLTTLTKAAEYVNYLSELHKLQGSILTRLKKEL